MVNGTNKSGNGTNNRLKGLMSEGDRLDKAIAMTSEIIGIGSVSGQNMRAQSEKLRKTGRNLKKIEHSAIPGLDKLIGLVKSAKLRNSLVIALVIAVCLAFTIYMQGYLAIIKNPTSST